MTVDGDIVRVLLRSGREIDVRLPSHVSYWYLASSNFGGTTSRFCVDVYELPIERVLVLEQAREPVGLPPTRPGSVDMNEAALLVLLWSPPRCPFCESTKVPCSCRPGPTP